MTGFVPLEQAMLTDVGIRRSHNQDAYAALVANDAKTWQERGSLFLVADGMGGHAVGELASKIAADLIPHTYHKHIAQGTAEAMRQAFSLANAQIHQRGQQNLEFEGMGTTGTALLLRPEGAWIAHVGDSRAYRVRGGRIEQLSYDHSFQWELARRQGVHPDEINVPSNVIVRSLGPEASVQIDIEGPHPILPGDIYLLCSDGLSNQISDQELGAILTVLPPAEASRFLVDMANLRGGPDNITVILVKVPGESTNGPADRPSKPVLSVPRWHHRLPWSGIALGSGVTLAILALVLIVLHAPELALAAFLLAGATLTAGILGLLRAYHREHWREHEERSEGALNIYRQTSCQIDRGLVIKLAEGVAHLEQQLRDKDMKADWDTHKEYLEAARRSLDNEEWVNAFRELCRAMAELMGPVRQQRQRGEVFNPLWEKGK